MFGVLAIIVLNYVLQIQWLSYLLWNICFILLFIYGVQGVGIINNVFLQQGWTKQRRKFLNILIILTF